MTKRLYLEDPYRTEFEADIIETLEVDDGLAVVFDETYFYPESGGQPFDLGTIDGLRVTRVSETDDETVLHFVEDRPRRAHVRCAIDEPRRRDHMQQHSGQHILSAAFVREAGAQTTSFHLGARVSTIDLDKTPLTSEEVVRAEAAANDVTRRAVPIRSSFASGSQAQTLDLRKPPPGGQTLRIVEIDGFDLQACCGTHPRSSGEIGPVVVRGFEKFKNGTRVEFLCGDRALEDYRMSVQRLRQLARVLSSAEAELVETAAKIQDERKSLSKELGNVRSELLLAVADSWMKDAEDIGERSVLVKRADDLGASELRTIAIKLVESPTRVVLLGAVADGKAHLVFARSKDGDGDMGALLTSSIHAVNGRGGGSPHLAQGGGSNTDGLDEALDTARKTLSS